MSCPRSLLLLVLSAALPACTILSPAPLIELAKASGAAASNLVANGPSKAHNTVWHEHRSIDNVCLEYNPATPDPDIPPALQAELRTHEIDSRVYELGALPASCIYRLSYTADIEWGSPPISGGYSSYLRDATLTLRDSNGLVLASSAYSLSGAFQMGKWASTRNKLKPVVTALVTGFEN